MAKLYITEFTRISTHVVGGAPVPIAPLPAVAEQVVDFSAGEAKSATFNAATNYVRVHADAGCSILMGDNPTATADKLRLGPGQTEYFEISLGQKISAIGNP
ncbi:MAG TPA: hypothetical protein VFI87_12030 [Hyphomicrobiaceae bacterium]|nr:hypothetical protein [Hyphomicrobiaceae bacterium]